MNGFTTFSYLICEKGGLAAEFLRKKNLQDGTSVTPFQLTKNSI